MKTEDLIELETKITILKEIQATMTVDELEYMEKQNDSLNTALYKLSLELYRTAKRLNYESIVELEDLTLNRYPYSYGNIDSEFSYKQNLAVAEKIDEILKITDEHSVFVNSYRTARDVIRIYYSELCSEEIEQKLSSAFPTDPMKKQDICRLYKNGKPIVKKYILEKLNDRVKIANKLINDVILLTISDELSNEDLYWLNGINKKPINKHEFVGLDSIKKLITLDLLSVVVINDIESLALTVKGKDVITLFNGYVVKNKLEE